MVQELNFQGYSDRIPPQNIDAEEAILGGILLDPEALGRVMEILRPEAFYISAHQEIYRAALALHTLGRPTDLMSITSWLHDNGLLEKVGGQSQLAQLVDRTISAVNIDQYAQLVMDKFLRRRLIHIGTDIAQLGYDTTSSLEKVLDLAEQKVFNVTQARPGTGLMATSDILTQTFSDIEQRHLGLVAPGIPCGFYDLDAMTQGFQRSDLIIAAGRPSMGKCVAYDSEILLADGSLVTIEQIYRDQQATLLTLGQDWRFYLTQPSVFVDDGVKPVFRVITRLGRFVETTLTHPYLTLQGWQKLSELQPGDKIAVPRQLAVFGNVILRECEVKLLAYLIGDGGLTRTNPIFTNINPQIQTDFIEAVHQFGKLKVRIETSQGTRTPSLCVSTDLEVVSSNRKQFGNQLQNLIQDKGLTDRTLAQQLEVSPSLLCAWKQGTCAPNQAHFDQLCDILEVTAYQLVAGGFQAINRENSLTKWLKELDLWGKDAHSKFIPPIVFKLARQQLALFLNRLFATDGWASVLTSGQVQLGFTSVSEKLARQVQHLLLRFGVIATLKARSVKYKETRRSAWQLDITDAVSIKTFISEIGIFGKEAALSQAEIALSNRKYQTNRDLIPVEIWQQLQLAKGEESWHSLAVRSEIAGYSNIHAGKRAPTRERLLTLAKSLEDQNLQNLATSDIYWDQIVSIELVGYKQVYDLTIPGTHNFIANDICVHNTSFVLNIARNIAAVQKLPIAVFSLEMSKEQLVYRLLASECRIESGRLRSGRISPHEWEALGSGIDFLSRLPVFIDDTPNISVVEMRSKARRLQAENGGVLGLVLIDYLQLMEGGGSENRVQELSRITRSLKGLARELSVPVIALSQLSRGVESRNNKRPMMSDLRECVTGDTLVVLANGQRVPIRDLVGQTPEVVSFNSQGKIVLAQSDLVWKVGVKPVYEVRLASGRSIKATHNHRLYGFDGWQEVKDLVPGSRLATARYLPEPELAEEWADLRVALLGQLIGDGSYLKGQPMRYCTASEENSNLVTMAAEQEFGAEVKRYKGRGKWHQLLISGNGNRWHPLGVNQWLRELGIFGQRSSEKRIPSSVSRLSNRQIALLLRHLWATDGCISIRQGRGGHRVFFSTISEGLAYDVAALLLRLGIQSTVRWSASQCFAIDVQGCEQQLKFLDQVGAFGPRIQPALELRLALQGVIANPNRDTLPKEIFEVVKAEMKAQGISHRQMAQLRGTAYGGSAHFKFAPSRTVLTQYADLLASDALKELVETDIFWDEVIAIECIGEQEVYDLTVPGTASWLADGIVSHNSGSIEQDADLIMMLYREEYYDPDTPDRGLAEVIIAKHRNGPVGTVKLLFDPQFTQFRNLAATH